MPDTKIISIHALREEGDLNLTPLLSWKAGFLSTPSARRATGCLADGARDAQFLSTPSARRATRLMVFVLRAVTLFLSTPSARRATGEHADLSALHDDFYPRPPRGGRLERRA